MSFQQGKTHKGTVVAHLIQDQQAIVAKGIQHTGLRHDKQMWLTEIRDLVTITIHPTLQPDLLNTREATPAILSRQPEILAHTIIQVPQGVLRMEVLDQEAHRVAVDLCIVDNKHYEKNNNTHNCRFINNINDGPEQV